MFSRSIRRLPAALIAIGLLFSLSASSALATSRTTQQATEVDNTSANLHATINAEGHKTTYNFGYGTSPNWEDWPSMTPIETTEASTSIEVDAKITELTSNTTYYFAIATRDHVTNELKVGNVVSFKTLNIAAHGMQFMAPQYPLNINGSLGKARVFEVEGGKYLKVDCNVRNLSGSLSAGSNSLSLLPELKSCKAEEPMGANLNVTVRMNSCRYVYDVRDNFGSYTGSFAVACSKEGDTIEYDVEGYCDFQVPAQSVLGTSSVSYFNTGPLSARYLELFGWAWGLKYTTSPEFICTTLGGIPKSGETGSMGPFEGTVLNGTTSGGAYNEFFVSG